MFESHETQRRGLWRPAVILGLAITIAFVLGACGSEDPTPTPRSQAPTATPAPQGFEAEWAALTAAAQDEGRLVIVTGGTASRAYRPLAAHFEDKFGIKTIVSTGSGTAQSQRILAEQGGGRFDVDIIMVGESSGLRVILGDAVQPLQPWLIHPEITDPAGWFQGQLWFIDAETQQYQLNYAAAFTPMTISARYNTELVSQADVDSIESVWDFLEPKWANSIVATNPAHGSGGQNIFQLMVHPDVGVEWLRRFFDPSHGVTFTEDLRAIGDGLAGGKWKWSLWGGGQEVDALKELGLPVTKMVKTLKEGNLLEGGGSSDSLLLPKVIPHPNAAKLFLNWFLSKEGQDARQKLSEGLGINPSLREDIPCEGPVIDPAECRQAGQQYLFVTSDPVYASQREEAMSTARSLFSEIRGQ